MEAAFGNVGTLTAVVGVSRPLVTSKDRSALREQLDRVVLLGNAHRIVVDFTNARWFGVPILDELIDTHHRLEAMGRELAIVSKTPSIHRMLQAAGVDRLQTFSSVQCAVAGIPETVHAVA